MVTAAHDAGELDVKSCLSESPTEGKRFMAHVESRNRLLSNPDNYCCAASVLPYDPAMIEEHDFRYAMESTRVVVQPERVIETFGSTTFSFLLVSELMDEVNTVRIRSGRIEAERPRIVSPHHFSKLLLDGFGDSAREYADWMEEHAQAFKILRYGFQFKKTDFEQSVVRDSLEAVIGRLEEDLVAKRDPTAALISGVDDAWEVCLLKFTTDLIQRSAGENMGEWKRRGLI